MPFLRNANRERYTVVDNGAIRDRRLSLKAIGLLVNLLSLPDDWEFSERGLMSMFRQDGQTSIRSGLAELEKFGYLKRERVRDREGRILRVEWVLSETGEGENPRLENPIMDNPSLGNSPQLNTDYNINTDVRSKERERTPENDGKQDNGLEASETGKGHDEEPVHEAVRYPQSPREVMEVAILQGCPMTTAEAQDFIDVNYAKGWKIGSTPVVDWRRLVKRWVLRERNWQRMGSGRNAPNPRGLDRTNYSSL